MAPHGKETAAEQGTPALCASGCGFYGSPATKNMCSNCYRVDHLFKAPDPVAGKKTDAGLAIPALDLQISAAVDAAAVEAPAAEAAPEPASKKAAPTRCMLCKKKVGLLGFACRCGGTFCSLHRYVDGHACDFDYKKADKEKIAKQNPLVVAPKITKI